MLFDLQGRRKRFIQVIYALLALLMGGSLVVFGIGGDAPGGLGDAFGLNQNGGSTGNADYDNRIERAQETLGTDPEDRAALLTLARYQYLAGNQALGGSNSEGQAEFTEEAEDRFERATDAWEEYMATEPPKPDDGVATLMFQAYSTLAGVRSDPVTAERAIEGGAEAAEVVAEARPGPNTYLQLATFAYFAGDKKTAEQASDKALAEVDGDARKQLKDQLDAAKENGRAFQQQLAAAAPDADDLQNPLQGLGGPGAETPSNINGGG